MTARDPSTTSRVLTSAREVALIVASILIAFGLDAWWDENKEQREVRESLAAVLGDLEASRDELDTVEQANTAFRNNAQRALALTSGEIGALSDAEVLALSGPLAGGALTFDPVVGSLNAMIAGDRLYQIEDAELRAALAAWPALMDEIGEDQHIFIRMYLAQRNRAVELGLLAPALEDEPMPETDYNRWALEISLADPLMRNRIAAHAHAVEGLDDELADLRIELEALIRRLRLALDLPAEATE